MSQPQARERWASPRRTFPTPRPLCRRGLGWGAPVAKLRCHGDTKNHAVLKVLTLSLIRRVLGEQDVEINI
ncbi:hypothetical protein E2C01_065702 [Portunus trituberculatus]|uniref:Uncharacterized protein n=1 Tax=Portunus trituberculatus TaxID=210409 RepID=A0A5B7HP49_PORTR|nr:hypothetical protein [Portunus trituberculatus]